MSFRVAISGLNAASADLAVTANNIANTGTTGFKGSRVQFAELFSVSATGVSNTTAGNGVRVADVAQQFNQGNIDFTDNSLDLALSGQGFFILSDGGAQAYTRAGAFQVDRDGYVVNARASACRSFPPTAQGGFNTGALEDLRLVTGESAPTATTSVDRAEPAGQRGAARCADLQPVGPGQLQPFVLDDGVRLARRGAHRHRLPRARPPP
jgi:flagellar hook protein FlgE